VSTDTTAPASAAIRERWANARGPLFTDLYELVMAQIYWREGIADQPAQFDHFFRRNPDYGTHQAGFCVTAGLGPFRGWLRGLRFGPDEVAALGALRDSAGNSMFAGDFLAWLAADDRFASLELTAIPEGRVVHPHVPIVSVTGPLAAAQLVETALLNHLNYATLIATKAARIVLSARGGTVLEFGMRRGPGAGVSDGVRAALIAGCAGTSDVEASVALGTKPRGTHAHALVQAYMANGGGELEAFRAMARAAPDDCVLLVDTVDTLHSGVPNAIRVFEELRAAGHRPAGVRLDSGDLAYLAVQTAQQLDSAGFGDVPVVLSGDLDELNIWQILTQVDEEARLVGLDPADVRRRLAYGAGTRLLTSHGDSSLGGVYKLVGLARDGVWVPAIKISEDPGKVPLPARKRAWRLYDRRRLAIVDLVGLPDDDPLAEPLIVTHHPTRPEVHTTRARDDIAELEPLHVAVDLEAPDEPLDELRARCHADIDRLDIGVRRLVNPHVYHVSATDRLHRLRADLIERTDPVIEPRRSDSWRGTGRV
jgi:nicotinate phosphoribosyltransferase